MGPNVVQSQRNTNSPLGSPCHECVCACAPRGTCHGAAKPTVTLMHLEIKVVVCKQYRPGVLRSIQEGLMVTARALVCH